MQLIIPITKKQINNKLNTNIVKKNENFLFFSDKLKKFGFNLAKFSGLSIGLSNFNEIFKKNLYFKAKEKILENFKIKWNVGIFSTNEYYISCLQLWSSTFDFLKDINFSIYEKIVDLFRRFSTVNFRFFRRQSAEKIGRKNFTVHETNNKYRAFRETAKSFAIGS